jgi:TRAP-type C4-dicarboxylate transport system permease small subunit
MNQTEAAMKKRTWILHLMIVAGLLFLAFATFLIAISAGAFASANGCELHEGFANPCVVGGRDYGETLYSLGLLGWLALVTLPIGLVLAGLYVVIVMVVWALRRRKAQPAA